ncbi:glutaredoxin 3 [Natronospira bacteriovora]|uniref:Glutaredoxin n=1 Tax=Natronospira bacteriovora TaxID=3069753 RepID=A0ABU0W766_9GAMM|nr:glutaredoxin 3 [Natronospira sp. AB-CW4]MDQ2069867.1 glutaredoxin 3 [Natronospira sp. AB-CW4]
MAQGRHKPVTMYLRPSCPFCLMARELLEARQVGVDEIDINVEPERRGEMIEKSGRRTVPQIFINDVPIGGYDELAALARSGRLDELLGRD